MQVLPRHRTITENVSSRYRNAVRMPSDVALKSSEARVEWLGIKVGVAEGPASSPLVDAS